VSVTISIFFRKRLEPKQSEEYFLLSKLKNENLLKAFCSTISFKPFQVLYFIYVLFKFLFFVHLELPFLSAYYFLFVVFFLCLFTFFRVFLFFAHSHSTIFFFPVFYAPHSFTYLFRFRFQFFVPTFLCNATSLDQEHHFCRL
jgi:hypothetical protein